MKTLKLHEIIKLNEDDKEILIECILPYKKSLNVLMPNSMLMVTSVSNAAQYAKIVPVEGFYEVLEEYVNKYSLPEDQETDKEVICFNSILLEKL